MYQRGPPIIPRGRGVWNLGRRPQDSVGGTVPSGTATHGWGVVDGCWSVDFLLATDGAWVMGGGTMVGVPCWCGLGGSSRWPKAAVDLATPGPDPALGQASVLGAEVISLVVCGVAC